MSRITLTVVTLAIVASSFVSTAAAQAPQMFNRPTADELFGRCADGCKPVAQRHNSLAMAVAQAPQANEQYIMVTGPGSIITGGNNPLTMNVLKDFARPVFIAGRIVNVDNIGFGTVSNKAFYLPKSLATTKYGPGYFESLSAGGVYPIGDLGFGPASDMTTLQVTVFDSQDGGRPIQNVFYTYWNNVRGGNVPIALNSVTIDSKNLITLNGRFPVGQSTVLIGQPGWDARVVRATSADGKSISFFVPLDEHAVPLYPSNCTAQSPWSVFLLTTDGDVYAFPNVVTVQSTGTAAVTVVQ